MSRRRQLILLALLLLIGQGLIAGHLDAAEMMHSPKAGGLGKTVNGMLGGMACSTAHTDYRKSGFRHDCCKGTGAPCCTTKDTRGFGSKVLVTSARPNSPQPVSSTRLSVCLSAFQAPGLKLGTHAPPPGGVPLYQLSSALLI